jgi:hypothetical protein
MCGIVGVFTLGKVPKNKEKLFKESALFLFTELLQLTEVRGKDATGITTFFDNGDYMIQKGGKQALDFINRFGNKAHDYSGFLNLCRDNKEVLRGLIGHCRKSSVGNTTDNENNHPIKAGEIIGIHNGTLKNHNKIFKKLDCKRDGEVDSEAIFRLLEHYTENGKEPFTLEMLKETVIRLDGTYSCICYNANNPYQVAIFRDGRPMEMAIIKPLNMVIIASEMTFIKQALFAYNKANNLYGKDFITITNTDIVTSSFLNDSVGIIDLTKEITKKSLLIDVIDKLDTVKEVRKWKVPYTSYTTNNWRNNNNTIKKPATSGGNVFLPKTTTNTTNTTNTTTTTTNNKSNTFKGKVYCKYLNAYVSEFEVKKAAKVGAIKIDSASGIITELDKEVENKPKEEPYKKKEVDMEVIPEIIEASKKATDNMLKYENNDDMCKDLNASSKQSLSVLAPFVLANRIRKHVYSKAFIEGASFYKKNNKDVTKLKKAENIIKTAKKLITILSLAAELNKMPTDTKIAVEASMEASDIAIPNIDDLDTILSIGDIKNSIAIETIYNKVKGMIDGKTNTAGGIK